MATGPVGVAINGGSRPFQFYRSGIFNCDYVTCGNEASDLNHAVLLVGYGVEGSTEYFILKNQWAETWGEQGYMRIINEGSGNGESGINIAPSIPTTDN